MKQKAFSYRLKRRLLSLPAQGASWLLSTPAIDRQLNARYEKARASFRRHLPPLSEFDKEIVAGLQSHGVYRTSLAALDLPGTAALWTSAIGIADAYSRRAAKGEFADDYTVQVSAEDMIRHPHVVRWALDDRILNIVETYLGLPAAYDTLNFFYTVADGRQVAARRWHRDIEDRRMVKVIVYLHDVDLTTGPIEILHRTVPGGDGLRGAGFPVLTHEMLEERLGAPLASRDVTTCVGEAETVIFTDVASHYHRGRPATGRDRCAIFYTFFSRPPLRPFFCERHMFSRSQLVQIAEGLPERARDSMLWHSTPPWPARLVPRAPL